MKVLLEEKGTLDKVEDLLLRNKYSEVKIKVKDETDDYIVGCNQVIHCFHIYSIKRLMGLTIPARDMTAYGRSFLDILFSKEEQGGGGHLWY